MTYDKFVDEMMAHARRIQCDNYAGDGYYRQDCWKDSWNDGTSPEDAVIADMGYWEPVE